MKRILLSVFAAFVAISADAQYYRMVIRTVDGLTHPFNVERVDSIYFELLKLGSNNGNDVNEISVTGSATDITSYTATITSWANILDNQSYETNFGIIYTPDSIPSKNNGTQITVSTSSLGSDAKYTVTLENLAPSTTYYYRSYVYQSGIWFYGKIKSFTTNRQGVNLVSGEVSKVTCFSAIVDGSVTLDEGTQYSDLTYGVCYGTDSVATTTFEYASTKDDEGNFTCQLLSLTGSTTYYYRSFAVAEGYKNYGPIRSFTTKDDDDIIETGEIDTITYTVTSKLKIRAGEYHSLLLGVCYGTNEFPTIDYQCVYADEVDDENIFTLTLEDIPYGTIYYRSFVRIDGVAHYGAVKSFERIMPVGEAVDLGLSVKWATFNVGASKPEGHGDYYAWGEVNTKIYYSWSTYKWCNGTSVSLTKYNAKSDYGTVDNKNTLDPEDDVAHVKWGGNWRMPTKEEQEELIQRCYWRWYDSGNSKYNGVAGYEVSGGLGNMDRSIFLPAVGYREDKYLNWCKENAYEGFYWSSSLYTEVEASSFYFFSVFNQLSHTNRNCGLPVRPVCP